VTSKKLIRPGEKLPLKLTADERTLVLDQVNCLDDEYMEAVRGAAPGQPVMLSLDELDDFGGYISAEANHTTNKKLQKKLDAIFQQIQDLLDTHTDEEPPKTVKIEDARKAKVLSDQTVQIAEWAAKALIAAEQLGIKNKWLEHFCLAPAQREVLLLVPGVSKVIKSKLLIKESSFTVAEVASMAMALAEDLPDGGPQKQVAVLFLAKYLIDQLQDGIVGKAKPKTPKAKTSKAKASAGTLYQFKIALVGSEPPIWRRIQVIDCTLDKFHEHIQTAMGWTNSHLHQFTINKHVYADPMLMEENFDEMEYLDSTTNRLGDILPKNGKRFSFAYEYDFGDGWDHEILFEGSPKLEPGKKYPLCLEGERACPPEDVGGIGGFYEYLQALADPKHEQHEQFMEWCGPFDPDEFDPGKATKAMKKGLPDWRSEM